MNDGTTKELLFQFGERFRLSKSRIQSTMKGRPFCVLESTNDVDGHFLCHLTNQESLAAESQFRFVHECERLAEIQCPSFSVPESFGVEHGYAYAISKKISGQRVSEINGAIERRDAVTVVIDIVRALLAIHDLGINYRRVVGDNVVVENGRATLAGCDSSRYLGTADLNRSSAIEFAAYASPELAGAIDHDIGPASDLYSVGVLLFRLLSGRLPFTASSPGEMLFRHLTFDPPWEWLPADIPCAIRGILEVLLQKDPPKRYQTAESLLFDLESTHQQMLKNGATENLVLCSKEVKAAVCDPAFVGRTRELNALEQQLSTNQDKAARKVLVACPSGIGKSRLILEFLRQSTKQNVNVLRGRGSNEARRKPMGPLQEVIGQLMDLAAGDVLLRQKLAVHTKSYGADLAAVCPEFVQLIKPELAGKKTGPDEFGQERVEKAVARLLTTISSNNFPVIIWIDDCQWLDEQTRKILGRIARSKATELMLLCSMRSECPDVVKEFDAVLEPQTTIELGPLSEAEVRLLQESMTGPLPDEAAETIVRHAAGSPFMAAAVTRGMFESGAIKRESNRWKIDQEKLENIQAADDAAQVLLQRLRLLPKETLHFLSVAAVVGREFDVQSLYEISKLENLHQLLQNARDKRLVWSKPDGNFSFSHDKIRESLIENLDSNAIEKIHLQYADFLSANRPHKIFDLAFHCHRGGRIACSLPYAIESAENARSQFSLVLAKEQLAIAIDGVEHADQATEYRLHMLASDIYMLDGDYDEAQKWLEKASELVGSPTEHARILLHTGELEFKRGNKEAAVENFERALKDLGESIPKRIALAVGKEVLTQTAHSLFPKRLEQRQQQPSSKDLLACRLYSRLAHGYWYTRDKHSTLWAHLRGLNHAECFAPSAELAQAYSEHAPVMSLIPWHARGLEYADRSLQLRNKFDDTWGLGQSRNFKSILYYSASKFDACIEQANQAVTILERTGDYWEVHIARYQLAAARYRKGDLEVAAREARQTYYSALELGDFQATANIIDVWIRADLNNLPQEVLEQETARTVNDMQAKCQVLLADGISHIRKGDYEAAAERFHEAIKRSKKASVCNTYITPNYAWYATAQRLSLAERKVRSPALDRVPLKKLRKSARAAVRMARKFQNDLPHALRELGAAYALGGQSPKARRCFENSLNVSKKQNARYETSQTQAMMCEFGELLGWRDIGVSLADAQQELRRIEEPVVKNSDRSELSIFDQFQSLLDVGRQISRLNDRESISKVVRKLAPRLLRCQRAFLIDHYQEHCSDRYDESLVNEAIDMRKTVTASEEIVDINDDGSCKGSYLACPVYMNDHPMAVLYVANDSVQGLFGKTEKRIAEFLSSVVSSTLEKVASLSDLEAMNLNLENRVKQRTQVIETRSQELEEAASELLKTQKYLEQSRDEAQQANQAKSEFLARMSHEIRTPISAILGFTELMIRGVVSDPYERLQKLGTIHSSGKHLLTVVNDLLDLTKIESGKNEIERMQVQVVKIAQDVIASLQSKALEKSIGIDLQILDWIPATICSDPTRLCQILTNVVGNAIKFTDKNGRITIRLSLETGDSQPKLVIEVEDNGIGMNMEQLTRIFDPFSQADTSITRRFGGTGLGLSISKGFVESLGGEIDVESELGKGSAFRIKIETGCLEESKFIDQASVQNEYVSSESLQSWQCTGLEGARALIVDDAETNREFLKLVLEDAGIEIEMCENGLEAVEWLKQDFDFDVVLMDMQMPVLDGYTAARQICEFGFDMPIIALTANSMKDDDKRCFEAGCSDYLSKPLDTALLFSKLNEHINFDGRQRDRSAALRSPGSSVLSDDIQLDERIAILADQFVEKLTGRLPEFQAAFDVGDLEELLKLAHWLKGTAGTLGLIELERVGKELELAGKANELDQVQDMLKTLEERVCLAK